MWGGGTMNEMVLALLICNIIAWSYIFYIKRRDNNLKIPSCEEFNKNANKIYKYINGEL